MQAHQQAHEQNRDQHLAGKRQGDTREHGGRAVAYGEGRNAVDGLVAHQFCQEHGPERKERDIAERPRQMAHGIPSPFALFPAQVHSTFRTGCSSITLAAAPVAPGARSKKPTPVIRAAVGAILVAKSGCTRDEPAGGVSKRSWGSAVSLTAVVPLKAPWGRYMSLTKAKDWGERVFTRFWSTSCLACWMFVSHGLSPTNTAVGVGISPTIVSPPGPCSTRWCRGHLEAGRTGQGDQLCNRRLDDTGPQVLAVDDVLADLRAVLVLTGLYRPAFGARLVDFRGKYCGLSLGRLRRGCDQPCRGLDFRRHDRRHNAERIHVCDRCAVRSGRRWQRTGGLGRLGRTGFRRRTRTTVHTRTSSFRPRHLGPRSREAVLRSAVPSRCFRGGDKPARRGISRPRRYR